MTVDHKKAFEESHAKAEKQFDNMRKDAKATEERVFGSAADIYNHEVALGITPDFSLYNLVLSLVDFTKCATARDSNQKLYEGLYPYIRRLNAQNKTLRHTLAKYDLSPEDRAYLDELNTAPETDPFTYATQLLNQIKERARQRSKAGLKFYNS